MSGNNMESLLMGGDDSSSGESDDEVNVPMSTATAAASAVAIAVPAPVAAAPIPVPAPAPQPAQVSIKAPVPGPSAPAAVPARGKSSQADQMARLKSLYSISKSTASSNTSTAGAIQANQAAPKPLQRPPVQQSQRPPQQQQKLQQQQRQPHQQMQQRQSHQPVGSHQANQQQHKRTQLYQQSSQQGQQQQQMPPRSQAQQRQPQYSQPSAQQRQYTQQPQQQRQSSQPIQHRQQQPQPIQHRQQMHSRQQHSQPQSRSGASSQQQNQQAAVDPFAPTPLSQIKQSQHNRRTHQQQQIQQQRQSTQPMSSRMPGSSSTATPSSREQDVKRQKEKFLMFTRVLIKYLEQKDKRMHAQAKTIIKDCAERNKRQEPGYESVTTSMKRRLKELVGDHYWKKANDYLVHFIEQKRRHAGLGASGSGSGSISSVEQKRRELRRRQELQQRQEQQRQAHEKLKKEQAVSIPKQRAAASVGMSGGAGAAPSLADVQKGIQDKREQLTIQAQTTTATTAKAPTKSKSKPAAASKASGNDSSKSTTKAKTTKKTVRRKSTGDPSTTSRKSAVSKMAPASSTTTTIVKRIVVEEPPREYKELMELIDHAVEYNWPSIGQLLGNKADLKLTDEERQLLYGDSPPESLTKKKTTKPPVKAAIGTPGTINSGSSISYQDQSPNQMVSDEQDQDDQKCTSKDGTRPGWGRSNVLSARAAWARIRLKELRQRKFSAANFSPVVAGGLLKLPTVSPHQEQPAPSATVASTVTSTPGPDTDTSIAPKPVVIEGSWVNEESAEQDKVLAVLSEGCQIYLKGVLQKAVQCARQRQNLDGIRLWHQQYAFNKGVSMISTGTLAKDIKSKSNDKSKKPPLALRLGCDVSRQAAQAHGNAALTVKRMEEALDRQTDIPSHIRELNAETLLEASSMGDLSWRPLLKCGAEKADYQAKRSFEVYGGKEAKDPPLGRVPKKAKLLVEDFVMGSGLTIDGPYHKSYTASSFISF